jgi:hypothetical protein
MESIDHYKYPGEDVLINEFDCHDSEELAVLEALSTGGNLANYVLSADISLI